jgi:hypothetical protein
MASLDVTFVLGDGATDGAMKIDRRTVKIQNGRGRIDVDASKSEHHVAMIFSGLPGSSLTYEIKHGATTLVKGKATVSFGQMEGAVKGPFKLGGA